MLPSFLLLIIFGLIISILGTRPPVEVTGPELLCDPRHGLPDSESCADAIEEFRNIIATRGYAFDKTIEFTSGTQPELSYIYPNEGVTRDRYVFFRPRPDIKNLCILEFRLFSLAQESRSPVYATHADMLTTAEDINTFCVVAEQAGGSKLVSYSWAADYKSTSFLAYLFAGSNEDVKLQKARQASIDYRPQLKDGEPGSSGGGQSGYDTDAGSSGGGDSSAKPTVGPDDKGKGFLAWYCNKIGGPETCWPGFTCRIGTLVNQAILWGVLKEKANEFVGTCMVTAASVFGS